MSSQQSRVTLVTGAGRGIGQALAANLVGRPNTIVYAAVRDPAKAEASLNELRKKAASGSEVRVLKLDSAVLSDAAAAVKEVQKNAEKIDLVIANAVAPMAPAATGDVSLFQDALNVNVLGPTALFQAFYPLLKKSSDARFIVINSIGASTSILKARVIPFQPETGFYGASKAAAAYYIAKLSEELKDAKEPILVGSIHPGLVTSDMGAAVMKSVGLDVKSIGPDSPYEALSPEKSAEAVLKLADSLTKEQAGYLLNYDGERLPF